MTPFMACGNLSNPDLSGLEKLQDGIAIQSAITEVASDSLRESHVVMVAEGQMTGEGLQ